MRDDEQIRQEVTDELEWEARMSGMHVVPEVRNGQVTLTGTVDSYPKKLNAERAVRSIAGVTAVANEIEVALPLHNRRNDEELKRTIENAITWNSSIDENKVKVTVYEGKVLLEGNVNWEYQRTKARLLAEDVIGVIDVLNLLRVDPEVPAADELLRKIIAAFKRNYYLDPDRIHVQVSGSKVTLEGEVRTLAEKFVAERVVWSSPGITEVENDLEVHPLIAVA